MVWANFMVLGLGAVLVTLPIVLHFLMQPKPQILEFPALQFVRQRRFSHQKRMRLRHAVLLLLRCLLILLMAAALAGPSVASRDFGGWVTLGGVGISTLIVVLALATVVLGATQKHRALIAVLAVVLVGHLVYGGWALLQLLNSDSPQLIGDSAAPVSAVVLIDNSVRMGYQHSNQTNLERAQEIATWLIRQFPSDSQAAILNTAVQVPFFAVDLGAARNQVENLELSFNTVALPSRLADGLILLEEAEHELKEIYVVTDLTQKSWESTNAMLQDELQQQPDLSIFVVDIGQKERNNFRLTPIELNRQNIAPGGQLTFHTQISGAQSAERTVRFALERPNSARPVIRDQKVLVPDTFIERTKTVSIERDKPTEVSFRFSDTLGLGVHHGSIEIIGKDSLVFDDQRYFTIEVHEAWRVLVIHGDGVTPDNLTEAIVEPEGSRFQATVVPQNDLPNDFESYQAIFWLDPEPGISEETWNQLREFVSQGRGLGIFLGSRAADGAFGHPSFQSTAAQYLLGGKLTRQWNRPEGDLFISAEYPAHPMLAPFRAEEASIPWFDFPVYTHWSIESDQRAAELPTQTLLRYGNGQPAIIERQIERGRVIIATTPITESAQPEGREPWNALFIGNAFPAWLLVRQIADTLVEDQTDNLNVRVGEFVRLRNDRRHHPLEYRVFTPRTKDSSSKMFAKDDSLGFRFTDSPGQYRLKGNLNGPVLRGFSVNLVAGQTDLTRVTAEQLDTILGSERYQLATQQDEINRQQGVTRRGQEFYPLLLLLLVVFMGMEYLLANRFYS